MYCKQREAPKNGVWQRYGHGWREECLKYAWTLSGCSPAKPVSLCLSASASPLSLPLPLPIPSLLPSPHPHPIFSCFSHRFPFPTWFHSCFPSSFPNYLISFLFPLLSRALRLLLSLYVRTIHNSFPTAYPLPSFLSVFCPLAAPLICRSGWLLTTLAAQDGRDPPQACHRRRWCLRQDLSADVSLLCYRPSISPSAVRS